MSGVGHSMRECRTDIQGEVEYECDACRSGRAHWQDVSRIGAQLRIGRHLLPGWTLRLRYASQLQRDGWAEVTARVAWCRQIPGTFDFVVGIAVRREDPDSALAFSALRDTRLAANRLATERVELPRWTALEAVGESERCVDGRMALQHAV